MSVELSTLLAPLKVGDVPGGNYTETEIDGTVQAKGEATCWDDLVGSLIASRLESTAGALQYNYDENSITMNSNGSISNRSDRLIFNFQVPHAFVAGSEMKLHIHWEQPDSDPREFTVQYRLQDNGQAKTTAWTTVVVSSNGVNCVFPYVSGTLNQITRLASIDLTGHNISTTVQFRLARTDSVSGDIEAVFIDAHVNRDMMGSRGEFVK